MSIRSSAKFIQARSLNLPLFMAGMMRMQRELALARARNETNPLVKQLQIDSARASHHAYLGYMGQV